MLFTLLKQIFVLFFQFVDEVIQIFLLLYIHLLLLLLLLVLLWLFWFFLVGFCVFGFCFVLFDEGFDLWEIFAYFSEFEGDCVKDFVEKVFFL